MYLPTYVSSPTGAAARNVTQLHLRLADKTAREDGSCFVAWRGSPAFTPRDRRGVDRGEEEEERG